MAVEMGRGIIVPDWANQLSTPTNIVELYRHNWAYKTKDGRDYDDKWTLNDLADTNFSELGGLAVKCSLRVYSRSAIARSSIRARSRSVDLTFGEPARLTSTQLLVAALYEKESPVEDNWISIVEKFAKDGNDTWILPADAIEMVETTEPIVSLTLPHEGVYAR